MARYEGAVGKAGPVRRPGGRRPGEEERHQGPAQHPAGRHRPAYADGRAAGRLDHGAARAGVDGPGLPLLAAARPLRATSRAFTKADFRGGTDEDQRRDVVRQRGRRAATPTRRAGLRAAGQDGAATSPASSGSTPARSSTSAASRRSSTPWAASTCTIDAGREVRAPAAGRQAAGRATPDGEWLRRAAGDLQEGQPPPAGAGRRWTTSGSATKNGVPDADYGRQRHQQQFVKAMVEPGAQQGRGDQPDQAGQGAPRGRQVADLQRPGQQRGRLGLRAARTSARTPSTMIKLPGGGVVERQEVPGRAAPARRHGLLHRRCTTSKLDAFLLEHPEFINKAK